MVPEPTYGGTNPDGSDCGAPLNLVYSESGLQRDLRAHGRDRMAGGGKRGPEVPPGSLQEDELPPLDSPPESGWRSSGGREGVRAGRRIGMYRAVRNIPGRSRTPQPPDPRLPIRDCGPVWRSYAGSRGVRPGESGSVGVRFGSIWSATNIPPSYDPFTLTWISPETSPGTLATRRLVSMLNEVSSRPGGKTSRNVGSSFMVACFT